MATLLDFIVFIISSLILVYVIVALVMWVCALANTYEDRNGPPRKH